MEEQTKTLTTFRVHGADGYVDIDSETPDEARKAFKKRHPTVKITKVKKLKGGDA